ncbi:MAG: tetratricopeptide repeat protein [Planctomycetota bacterium]|nr:MAG: tetratricopeptide repeat protein [Planctomycetota bacterium]
MQDRVAIFFTAKPPRTSAVTRGLAVLAVCVILLLVGQSSVAQSWEEKTRENFAPPTIARPEFKIQSPGNSMDPPASPPEGEHPVEPPPGHGGGGSGWCPGVYPCWPWYPYGCHRAYRRWWWAYPVYPEYGYHYPLGPTYPVYPVPYPVYVPVDPPGGGVSEPFVPPAAPLRADDTSPDREEMLAELDRRARQAAEQEIRIGDSLFAEGKYAEASVRYRRAIRADGTLADAWIRQALALIAVGNYPTAVEMMKRGLAIDPDWPKKGFNLDQLYGANGIAKRIHIGDLAREVAADPNHAGRLFLLGVMLYLDGETDSAADFLRRAAANDPAGTLPVASFLENGEN